MLLSSEPSTFACQIWEENQTTGSWSTCCLVAWETSTHWATTIQNASRKDAKAPEFSTITAKLLDKSRILAKSSDGTDTTIALIGKQFGKRNFSSIISSNSGPLTKRSSLCSKTNFRKNRYNKATAKCTPCHQSYHAVEDCWFLHPEKARTS